MSLYDDLGVSDDASQDEIKKAYRDKARETSSGHRGDPKEFNKVARAYAVLADPTSAIGTIVVRIPKSPTRKSLPRF